MSLLESQMLFARLFAQLIQRALDEGYGVTLGHVERSPDEAARLGFRNSNHTRRLAGDLHLFRAENGSWTYLTATEDHQTLGEWWESQHDLARWGGRFNDGNHYSIEWEGIQ